MLKGFEWLDIDETRAAKTGDIENNLSGIIDSIIDCLSERFASDDGLI